ncbi:CpsD/CapB family tyrosine-protein kinase [Parasporobacterium paucivorans]|uniref:non-specific protein-tyrosine kinase n=1 Tax=Parasporobacterium paucivorans DSM 15970 TaxID=1122934 RepID=A0A1M6GUA6_9FIRM|nr:CpsD/CapB family tyrosine-protein kinase [Parasporobacterium paucivorans]SHJ13430.1 capsular exopolysaccharide family [Parasporobacterium paucivorans DSM 15970]
MKTVKINKLIKLDYYADEAYKKLRTNIQFSGHDIKTVGITSCLDDEGKSSIAFNLALSTASAGKRTVFVDADLRKSVTMGRYRIEENVEGLSHYLSGIDAEESVYPTSISNLYMLFSGPLPPNPSELLNGERFRNLVRRLRQEYDYVIIDTPPLGKVIDAAVVAGVCDGVILVISTNRVSYKFAQAVKEQLEKTGCRILGAVLNNVEISKSGLYGKYYGKYYGKHNEKYAGDESPGNGGS